MRAVKNAIKKAMREIAAARYYSGKLRLIEAKIDYLRRNDIYQSFPNTSPRPTIYDYPFSRKGDKKYLDFFYSVSRNADIDFIPLTTYFINVEPLLNQFQYLAGIADKNYYDLHFDGINTPKTYLRKINRAYYDHEYRHVELSDSKILGLLEGASRVILKPSVESGAGKSIELFNRASEGFRNTEKILDQSFLDEYPDFVLQECVVQHPYFNKFNPDSNNTVRILTYRSVIDDRIHVLHRLLRVGKKGSFLDHDNFGGIAIGITADAELKDVGFDSAGNRYTTFNDVNLSGQAEVPCIGQLEQIATNIATDIFYGRLLAFDFTVDESGQPLLIEINCWRNGVSQYQMNNGSLFQEFTREILDYCVGKSYAHRFKI